MVVIYADEREPAARSGGSRLASASSREQPSELPQVSLAAGDLQHCTDQGADHTVKKRVGGDAVRGQVVPPGPPRVGDDPLEAGVVAPRGGKGREVVDALHQLARGREEVQVQQAWHVARAVALQGGKDLVVDHPV